MNSIILGATGLTGGQILKYAEQSNAIAKITTLSRSAVNGSSKVNSVINSNTDEWYPEIAKQKNFDIFFSAFGTTITQAGSIENLRKIQYEINLNSAKAAREANIKCYVLVTTMGASSSSFVPFLKITGELEDEVKKLGFQRVIILRPGVILGERNKPFPTFNSLGAKLGAYFRGTILDGIFRSVYAEEMGKVAVSLATKPLPANGEKEVLLIGPKELVKLAKDL